MVAVACACAAIAAPQVVRADGTYQVNDYAQGHAFFITPPGQNGLTTALDAIAFETSQVHAAHNADTLPLYANLLYGYHGLTDAQLPQYFPDESFGVRPQDIIRQEAPGPGTTILRDKYDIPHVYGTTLAATGFGAGYAAAEDRLFFMDVLRHVGAGHMTGFLGPSCSDESMDHGQLLVTGYTQAQKQAQIDETVAMDPVQGPRAKQLLDGYVAGINQYISDATTDPTNKLPADYAAVGLTPQPWVETDIVDVGALIGAQLGRGGGGEVDNAAFLAFLVKRFGVGDAMKVFQDMKEQNDPGAPTTADTPFPYEIPGTIDPSTTALTDSPALTGTQAQTTFDCHLFDSLLSGNIGLPAPLASAPELRATMLSGIHFPQHLSNALLVDAAHSATGHPIAVFGSQAGYFAPEIWMAEDLHGPDFDAEGFGIPGINLLVEIGRGQDFAWSATSASTDNVDMVAEQICDPNGGAPAAQGTSYLYNGSCLAMTSAPDTQVAVTKPGGIGPPTVFTQPLYTTIHGVVQGWTTVGGKPVAIAMRRSTYLREPQSVLGFLRWATPSITHDAQSWCDGTQYIDFPFNWLYADDTDIAYCISGRDPVRQSNVDPNLPAWGTGIAEWQGFLPHAAHPHQIGAAKGFITSWNNKPAPMFSANDGEYGYGLTYRSQSLDDAIRAAFAASGGHIAEAQLVSAMEDAASVDLQGTRVLPELLPWLASQSHSPQVTQMLRRLSGWLAAGAHRVRAHPGDAQYADAPAVAIMDEFYPRLIEALFNPLFADPTKPNSGISQVSGMDSQYSSVPSEWANNPNFDGRHLGSAYDGGWDGFLVKALRTIRGEPVALPYSDALTSRMCGSGPASCASAIEAALNKTAAELQSLNGSADVSAWTVTQAAVTAKQSVPQYDQIQYTAVGLVGQNPQDWQNRPTQQQVVSFPAHRARPVAAAGNQGASVSSNPNTAPPIGTGPGVALGALLAAAAALRVRRRRRRSGS